MAQPILLIEVSGLTSLGALDVRHTDFFLKFKFLLWVDGLYFVAAYVFVFVCQQVIASFLLGAGLGLLRLLC